MKDYDDKLVDLFSYIVMVNTLEEALLFDSDEDQKDPSLRKLVTEIHGLP